MRQLSSLQFVDHATRQSLYITQLQCIPDHLAYHGVRRSEMPDSHPVKFCEEQSPTGWAGMSVLGVALVLLAVRPPETRLANAAPA